MESGLCQALKNRWVLAACRVYDLIEGNKGRQYVSKHFTK